MLVDGERLKLLVASASREVILCAPFIKSHAFRIVLSAVPAGVPVITYTRWRPEEVAAGISDLEVFDLVAGRDGARLFLLNELHAKLYVADSNCLLGSANLTGAALGWSQHPNVEILTTAQRTDADVTRLLTRLSGAHEATASIRMQVAEKAASIDKPDLHEVALDDDTLIRAARPWLPRCASPASLYAVYRNPTTTSVVLGTRSDAIEDLADLGPSSGLDELAFKRYVEDALSQIPAMRAILDRIPGKLTDVDGMSIIATLRPDYSGGELLKQWQIVRDWIATFYAGRFEVAPDSFVVRLKS